MLLPLLLACTDPAPPSDTSSQSTYVPWTRERARLTERSAGGRSLRRGIVHLHSHLSHDACDGDPMPNGVPDEECLGSLRSALCDAAIDVAFVTDHPAHAAEQSYIDMLLSRPDLGDVIADGVANRIACGDGATTLTLPGIEDELMPVALDRHVAGDAATNDAIYNGTGADTIAAEIAAGALVMQAHTESRTLDTLLAEQAAGLTGVEIFNLHAMLDPDLREEFLGLDPWSTVAALAPFLSGDTDAVPDLAFLAFFEEQTVSVERWDALSAVAPTVGIAGTDAHENAFPSLASDGERFDSYRRMMSWFSNVLLVDGDGPAEAEAALRDGRLFVAFEALGTPSGFDVRWGDQEMSGSGPAGGELVVSCPTLAATSPRDGDPPEISVVVLKDGAPWRDGCGTFPMAEPGVYRVRVDIVPHHLVGFLDDQAEALVRPYPWLYSGAFRAL
jgi:hypothetical protein